jgi:hypothetical protein
VTASADLVDLLAHRWAELALRGLWQGALLAAAAGLALRALPRLPAAARHAAWTVALSLLVAAPVVGVVGSWRSAAAPRLSALGARLGRDGARHR